VRLGRRYLCRLEDVEAWVAGQASIASAASDAILKVMRERAMQRARLIALAGQAPEDEPPSMASARVGEALTARGFTRDGRNGKSYRRGPVSVRFFGGLHGKKASCELSIYGRWNGIDQLEMSGREQTMLVVIDAVLEHLRERHELDAPYVKVAPEKGKRSGHPKAEHLQET